MLKLRGTESQRETFDGDWKGGLCEYNIAISPLLPGAQRRCGGPSPRRHSVVWHAVRFSLLTVSSWTSSHANTWATGGFSYLVVGQEYLIIFKKTVRHIIPRLPKYDLLFFFLFFFPSLPSQQFSPLQFGKRARRWKGTDTQCSNLDKVWLALIKVIEQTEKNGKHRAKTVTAFQEAANGNISNTMALKSSTKRRQWCGVWLTQIDMSSLT